MKRTRVLIETSRKGRTSAAGLPAPFAPVTPVGIGCLRLGMGFDGNRKIAATVRFGLSTGYLFRHRGRRPNDGRSRPISEVLGKLGRRARAGGRRVGRTRG